MRNYVHADLHRIFRRVSRWVIVILFLAIGLGFEFYQAVTRSYNSVNLISAATSFFDLAGVILGVIEIQSVFADDFHAKTMQIAIGLGISRPKIVLAKLLDFGILALIDMLAAMILFTLGGMACGISLMGEQIYLMFISALGNAVLITIVAAITMIPVFYMQSTAFAIVFFLIISMDPLKIVFQLLSTKEIVLNLHLLDIMFSSVSNTLFSQLSLRNGFPIAQLVGVIAYLAAAYGLAVLAFRKRELEF